MDKGGRAWRGWFPFEGELTSGRADRKEGIYFGAELDESDPRVRAGTPLHGPNLFPAEVPELRAAVLDHLEAMTGVATPCSGAWRSASASTASGSTTNLTADPLVLFRIFRYPPEAGVVEPNWGVAEHTDYGLLTILRPGRPRRARGARADRLDRRAADPGHVRVQPRRHARADDRRPLPLDAAPRAQPQRRRSPLVPVLLRPGMGRAGAPGPARRRGADPRPGLGGTARTCSPSTAPTASTCWSKVGRVFPDLKASVLDDAALSAVGGPSGELRHPADRALGVAAVGPARGRGARTRGGRARWWSGRRRGRCRRTRGRRSRTGL